MFLEGLKALQADPDTKVICLVSKPPSPSVMEKVLAQVAVGDNPTVVCLLGDDLTKVAAAKNAIPAKTLRDAALLAAKAAGAKVNLSEKARNAGMLELKKLAKTLRVRARLKSTQRYLRGLFSGGTLCYESQVIWRDMLKEKVLSNAPLEKESQ